MRRCLAPLVLLDGAALVTLRRQPVEVAQHVRALHAWIEDAGADGAVAAFAGAALWLLACWVAVGLLTAGAAGLPGATGRIGAAVCRRVVPRAVRAALAGTAGLGVLLAPVVASAAASHQSTLPAPTWPVSATVPAPAWPSVPPHARPAPKQARQQFAPTTSHENDAIERVRRGDSLWLIAARRLGPDATAHDVAQSWPRWYAANRDVIGDDPDHLLPGQVLHAPAGE